MIGRVFFALLRPSVIAILVGIAPFVHISIARAASLERLFTFSGPPESAEGPVPDLVADQRGDLFGVTPQGGAQNVGAVFELIPPTTPGGQWVEQVIYSFTGTDPTPAGGLIIDANDALYGATTHGGANGEGNVYRLTPPARPGGQWSETILHQFATFSGDGQEPHGRLLMDANGAIYGTTFNGSSSHCLFGCGIVYQLVPPSQQDGAWTYNILHVFTEGSDGSHPIYGLAMDRNGVLYGSTVHGGSPDPDCYNGIDHGCGTIFSISPPTRPSGSWTENVLYRFTIANLQFSSAVVVDQDSAIYGAIANGGPKSEGQVFRLARSGDGYVYRQIANFGDLRGAFPYGLSLVGSETLYGATEGGGPQGLGTIYKLEPDTTPAGTWQLTRIAISRTVAQSGPQIALVDAETGTIYVIAQGGGISGTLFQVTQ